MEFQQKMGWLARMALLVFILAAAGFLSAITAMRLAIQGREVKVPNVVGMKAGDAQAALSQSRLGMKIADRVFSDKPLDYVVRQSPAAGARVKTSQRTHVVLSLGPQRVSVPELEGQTVRAARIELLRGGLQLGEISSIHVSEQEPDLVLKQNPPPRATNAGGPRVNLLVSLGPAEAFFAMPELAGLTLAEAQARLSAAGLRLSNMRFVLYAEVPKGTVIAQAPARGARIAAGTTVELQVVE